jgi:hypothetical protein
MLRVPGVIELAMTVVFIILYEEENTQVIFSLNSCCHQTTDLS